MRALLSAAHDASRSPMLKTPYLYIIAFVSGMTTLAIELSASRLLGSVFGNSNLVWANVIGLMLLYLTAGYFLGGRIADRYPRETVLLKLILWAAALSGLIPLIARPIISRAAQAVFGAEAALALGSFFAILVLFSVPVTLLGTVSPFVIRLALRDIAASGKVAGHVYAISTLGSLFGAFLPVLVTIPQIGTTSTFLLFAGLLFAVAFVALCRVNRRAAIPYLAMPIALALLTLSVSAGPLRPPASGASLQYEGESAYNYIQVQEDSAGYRYLYLNEGPRRAQSMARDRGLFWRNLGIFLGSALLQRRSLPRRPAVFRAPDWFGGGHHPTDSMRMSTATFRSTASNWIAEIVAVGEQYFDMNAQAMPQLTTHVGDGRFLLNQLDQMYTVIGIDAYRPPYIPHIPGI